MFRECNYYAIIESSTRLQLSDSAAKSDISRVTIPYPVVPHALTLQL